MFLVHGNSRDGRRLSVLPFELEQIIEARLLGLS
ncbi:hypothetical protein M8C21_009203 [Ambrosia artemisiifolia]|uniref:Uncharacterized protein n=1 Tax=Ambrosia artemisiifolia TaxID=4212 RepID=A0AAD5GQX1_AMBAR|nr:hypothetical protein M8C21_009203 [Ambrosia artemisiifolia]